MDQKLFTKSAFKIAMGCPTRLYYAYDPETYANQDEGNEFLMALAKGGFQVGALAKLYCGVDVDLEGSEKYDLPLAQTAELLKRETVTIAEAAFRFSDCFVRADIVRKTPQGIDLIEVKAKIKAYDKRKDELSNRLKEIMGESETLNGFCGQAVWRNQKKSTISKTKIKAFYPDVDLDKITLATQTRVFSIKEAE